jgi:hypothetical protein
MDRLAITALEERPEASLDGSSVAARNVNEVMTRHRALLISTPKCRGSSQGKRWTMSKPDPDVRLTQLAAPVRPSRTRISRTRRHTPS